MFNAKYPFLLLCLLVLGSPARSQEPEDFHTQIMRSTVKIIHDKSTATGFILSPDKGQTFLLVTAAHVLESTPGDEITVIFRVKEEEGVYKKEPLKVTARQKDQPIWQQHPSQDVAVVRVVPPPNSDLAVVSTERLATDETLRLGKIHPGTDLHCLGYPHRVEASSAGFPILRKGPLASFPILPTARTKTFLLSSNSFEGDSGGPVYVSKASPNADCDAEESLILGLITGQHFIDEDLKMIYGTTKIRHRLGLASVVHASFIMETIELLK